MKKHIIPFSIAVVMATGCAKAPSPAREEAKQAKAETVTVALDSSSTVLKLPSELLPYEEVQLYSKIPGFIKEIYVDRGSKVKKGDLLALIEAPEVQAQLNESKARMYSAEALYRTSVSNYKRLQAAARTQGAVAPADMEAALTKVTADSMMWISGKANYDGMLQTYSYSRLRAPFDGVVTEKGVSPGALIGSRAKDQPLFVIKQENKLRLTCAIPEVVAGSQIENPEIAFIVKAFPGETFKGFVKRNSESLVKEIRAQVIELDVDNSKGKLKSGMYAEIRLKMRRSFKSLIVPRSSVITGTEKQYVIRLENRTAHKVDITKGFEQEDKIEVFGDIHQGDTLMLHASDDITDGQKVR